MSSSAVIVQLHNWKSIINFVFSMEKVDILRFDIHL